MLLPVFTESSPDLQRKFRQMTDSVDFFRKKNSTIREIDVYLYSKNTVNLQYKYLFLQLKRVIEKD